MVMEINNTLNKLDHYLNRLGAEQNAGLSDRQVTEKSVALRSGTDTVSISSAGLKALAADAALEAPEIRQDKVDAIKAALSDGSYKMDSKAIAAGLVSAAKELL
jgi:negative regulator of flagellin synthesis FlgM